MASRTQDQIKASWNETDKVAVSVVCATYNHELYIREALEGFLMQETNFPFEIIIHDDASTDNTANIIREYASKYPAIIRPIFQSENQYSKGGFKPGEYAAGFAKGEYIALCEGDDYWVSENKLQLQHDALKLQSSVSFCFHSAFIRDGSAVSPRPEWRYTAGSRFTTSDILESPRLSFAPTPSYFLKKSVYELMPDWVRTDAPVGDVFVELYAATSGEVIYLDEPMAAYRRNSLGSWTSTLALDRVAQISHYRRLIQSLEKFLKEFPELSNSVKKKTALLEVIVARDNLILGNYEDFRQSITRSASLYYPLSRKQILLFKFKNCKPILRAFTFRGLFFRTLLRLKN